MVGPYYVRQPLLIFNTFQLYQNIILGGTSVWFFWGLDSVASRSASFILPLAMHHCMKSVFGIMLEPPDWLELDCWLLLESIVRLSAGYLFGHCKTSTLWWVLEFLCLWCLVWKISNWSVDKVPGCLGDCLNRINLWDEKIVTDSLILVFKIVGLFYSVELFLLNVSIFRALSNIWKVNNQNQ